MDDHTRDESVAPPPSGRNPTGWLPDEGRWKHDTLRRATVHGVKLFNAEHYHDSHDCFEDEWFNYGHGTLEKDFLQGMVQVAAGAYKFVGYDNPAGLQKLLDTGRGYLDDVPADYYGVNVRGLRRDVEDVLANHSALAEWQIELDGSYPTADDGDLAYAASLP